MCIGVLRCDRMFCLQRRERADEWRKKEMEKSTERKKHTPEWDVCACASARAYAHEMDECISGLKLESSQYYSSCSCRLSAASVDVSCRRCRSTRMRFAPNSTDCYAQNTMSRTKCIAFNLDLKTAVVRYASGHTPIARIRCSIIGFIVIRKQLKVANANANRNALVCHSVVFFPLNCYVIRACR